ncbi:MAG: deoxyguanosinetriphosphate triphosphohydrolase [Maricaulaceae bacterium]|jgi:dGTPase
MTPEGPDYPGTVWRAPFACDPQESRGRRHPEPASRTRTPFQRDRDRIIHSTAFRRLKGKTQVFVAHEGDLYRTRLTHSLEVSQIARSIARVLGADEDLAETLALAHDLGHPPFGHAGEAALQDCMTDFGGFDHNAQTLRIVTELEARYAEFNGLNLTWETLEGVVKHNGPVLTDEVSEDDLPWALKAYEGWRELELDTFAGLEAQIAALADDIAYNNHDIDDGLRAGLFTVEDMLALPMVGDAFLEVITAYPTLEQARLNHEAVRRTIGAMIADLVAESRRRLDAARPQSAEEVRALPDRLVSFSADMEAIEKPLRAFLWENMYRHYKVNRMIARARKVVAELFEAFMNDPAMLPPGWSEAAGGPGEAVTARVVCDYIAGMTDAFALEEHRKLLGAQLA